MTLKFEGREYTDEHTFYVEEGEPDQSVRTKFTLEPFGPGLGGFVIEQTQVPMGHVDTWLETGEWRRGWDDFGKPTINLLNEGDKYLVVMEEGIEYIVGA